MKIKDLRELAGPVARHVETIGRRLRPTTPADELAERARHAVTTQLDRMADAARRWRAESPRIRRMQDAIENDRVEEVEPPDRLAKWAARRLPSASRLRAGSRIAGLRSLGRERKLGDTDDFVSVEFFEAGVAAARPVGRVRTPTTFGTGFLVGHDLMLTNNHVIDGPDFAAASELELDAEENRIGRPKPMQVFRLDPDRFFATHPRLDFTIVAVEPESDLGAPLGAYGYHPLIAGEGKIRLGESVNVVQHPGGGPKNVVVHNSRLIFLANDAVEDAFCFYTSDTDEGSSGAPVFNNRWEVIAVHHASVPKTDKNGNLVDRHGKTLGIDRARERPEEIVWIANEGVRISRLVAGLRDLELEDPHSGARDELLALWDRKPPRPGTLGQESRPAAPAAPAGVGEAHRVQLSDGETTIPLSIIIRVGD